MQGDDNGFLYSPWEHVVNCFSIGDFPSTRWMVLVPIFPIRAYVLIASQLDRNHNRIQLETCPTLDSNHNRIQLETSQNIHLSNTSNWVIVRLFFFFFNYCNCTKLILGYQSYFKDPWSKLFLQNGSCC
jgi:hypothetical protein